MTRWSDSGADVHGEAGLCAVDPSEAGTIGRLAALLGSSGTLVAGFGLDAERLPLSHAPFGLAPSMTSGAPMRGWSSPNAGRPGAGSPTTVEAMRSASTFVRRADQPTWTAGAPSLAISSWRTLSPIAITTAIDKIIQAAIPNAST